MVGGTWEDMLKLSAQLIKDPSYFSKCFIEVRIQLDKAFTLSGQTLRCVLLRGVTLPPEKVSFPIFSPNSAPALFLGFTHI